MFDNISMFGYVSDNPAYRAAYDMQVLAQLEKDEKEEELRRTYGNGSVFPMEVPSWLR